MSKIALLFVGIALLAVSGYYFFAVNSHSIVTKQTIHSDFPSASAQSVLPVSNALAAVNKTPPIIPKPVTATAVPKKVNVADSLRFALESVVEESIEQALWDEEDSDSEKLQ